ncbi:MAG: MBL fold metallo-hydrolase [Deltaproteobacteria bacterium]|jgi:phosphoribosyl 1,2-cyclic phosphodiesterase|nr:MBL fold metallo-hydrolase [Deltaproteobacteria bacterium]
MHFCLLASGSKGNSLWVEENDQAILIDNGLTLEEFEKRVASRNLNLRNLVSIFLTHAHSDHVSGVGLLARSRSLKVYGSGGTLRRSKKFLAHTQCIPITSQHTYSVGTLKLQPIPSSHDCEEPFVYLINGKEHSFGVATDLGVVTHQIHQSFLNLDALILEFNHDMTMLIEGPYPLFLKQRIISRKGHLSNEAAATFLTKIVHPKLQHVVLGHISEENNRPELAYNSACEALKNYLGKINIIVASQREPTPIIKI